jgi:hypothetical protein
VMARSVPADERGIGSVLWRGGEVDTTFGFEEEADAPTWIKEKSQGRVLELSAK